MKIVRLQAEGFKRLVAVDITPGSDLVEVRGKNAQGKTSVLDAIMAALGGAAAAPIKPVRTGEEYAIIKLDMGDVKVTRYFDDKGDMLRVENAEGAVFTKGQTMLDALVGRIAFDPLAFARMLPAAQAAELRRLVPITHEVEGKRVPLDLDSLAKLDREDTAARRDINRDGKALRARIDAIEVSGIVPEVKPDREAIEAELAGAADKNTAIERERLRREDVSGRIVATENAVEGCRRRAEQLRAEAMLADQEADALERKADEARDTLKALPELEQPVDTTEVRERLAQAARDIALLDRVAEKERLSKEFEDLRAKSEAFTKAMADRAALREKALAEAEMPVKGLSFGTFGEDLLVTFDGEPFEQASGAQQLRVSMALAMAANPKLRVMLIKDGSLLDEDGLQLVKEMASSGDYQVWMEAVGDGGAGIVMEAGVVRGAPEPERVEPPKRRRAKAEAEGAEQNETDGAAEASPERVRHTTPEQAAPVAEAVSRRKPAAMREFTTPRPGDLFGGDS